MTTVGTPAHLDIKGTRLLAEERYHRCFHPLGVIQQIHAILATGSIIRYTQKIKAPTLILHGTKDKLIPPHHSKLLAKTIKNSTLVTIDGMAHDIPVYYHRHLVSLISQHIKNNSS